jgi:alpha-ketoglutarate-dependent taurine dioxygenase
MAIRFQDIKPKVGSRVVWGSRDDLFTPEAAQELRRKVDERSVLIFPKLNLTDEEQLEITALMGAKVKFTGHIRGRDEEIYQVTLDKKLNTRPEYVLGTYFWHMDGMPVEIPPPFATLLSARKVAAKGGQTDFASTTAAYAGLPDNEREALEDLIVVHSVKASMVPIQDAIPPDEYERVIGIRGEKERPLVWTHETGRKSMLIGTTADRIAGMPIPEGRALLTRLVEWSAQPDYSLRHDWQEGDFVIWDNTGALHRAIPYDPESGRMMHRTSIS